MVVKSLSLVELKKQQWAKEKGRYNIYIFVVLASDYFQLFKIYFWFTTTFFRRASKIKQLLEKSKHANCFQWSEVFQILMNQFDQGISLNIIFISSLQGSCYLSGNTFKWHWSSSHIQRFTNTKKFKFSSNFSR